MKPFRMNEHLPHDVTNDYDELFKEAMEYLKLVGLEHKALHSTNLLSGGEKQRVVMARQLAAKPKLLLLDEPVTMTGPDTKQEVLDVIKSLKEKLNIPIIVVSHLPEIHAYLADRLVFLENGKIAADGEPSLVLKNFLRDMKPREELAEPENKEICIKVKEISKRYSIIRMGEVLNIKNFSLDVYRGEILAFIGSSGTGKTTLMKLMEGLVRPKSGTVEYLCNGDWVDVTEYSREAHGTPANYECHEPGILNVRELHGQGPDSIQAKHEEERCDRTCKRSSQGNGSLG